MSNDVERLLREVRPAVRPASEATRLARDRLVATVAGTKRDVRQLRFPHLTGRRTLVAAGVAAILVAAPAYAIATGVIDFSKAEPAPTVVQKRFAELGHGAPIPKMDPRVLPLSARKVTEFHLATGSYTLWVAPTVGGGFCNEFTGFAGGCVATRATPTGIPPLAASEVNPWLINVTTRQRSNGPMGPDLLGGSVLARGTSELELWFEDGAHVSLPVVWVSAPIDAGFFLYSVPDEHRVAGHLPVSLVARGIGGKVLAQTAEQVAPHGPPPHAPGS